MCAMENLFHSCHGRGIFEIVEKSFEGYAGSMIVKVKEGYRVVAESGRNMGTYPTREQAEKRLRQIEMFKHMKKK